MTYTTYQVLSVEKQNLLSLEEIKSYLRISEDYDDKLLAELALSAISSAEKFTRLSLLTKNIEVKSYSNAKSITLPLVPVININNISNDERVLEKEEYALFVDTIKFADSNKNITINYVSGLQTIESDLKQGLLIHISSMYDQELVNFSFPKEALSLYQTYRKILI